MFNSHKAGPEQAAFFSSVMDAINEGVLIINLDGKIEAANRTARMTFGLTDNTGETYISSLFGEARDLRGRVLEENELPHLKAVAGNTPLANVDLTITLVTGLDLYLRVNAVPVSGYDGRAISVVLSFTDVTLEYANQAKVKKLIHSLQNIPIAVIIFHSDLTIEYVNRFYLQHTGFRESELIGKNISVLPADTGGNRLEQFIIGLTSGKVQQIEREVIYYNHVSCWEMVTVSSIVNTDNKADYYVAVIEDITDRRFQFLELLHTKKAAEESARLKSNLLTNMSHELRTPINGILGNTQLLAYEEVSEDQKIFIQSIHQSAKRLLNTLTAILELAEFEAAKNDTRQEPVHPVLLAEEVLKEFQEEVNRKNLIIKLPPAEQVQYIQTDRQLLRRTLFHILENAVKFTNTGSVEIAVTLKNDEEYPYCAVKISDTGIGISAEYIDLIFEPFRQASEGFRRNYEGNGLGLTLAQKCVQALGGIIRVKSEVNKGSIFTVILPL